MKKFLLSMTMLSFITTQAQAVRTSISDPEFFEDLADYFTSQKATTPPQQTTTPPQKLEFVNDRDSAQLLRNIAEGSGRAMFVLPIVVLLLTSEQKPQIKGVAIVGRPHSITGTDISPSWEDMDKIWHLTFGGEDLREPVREPQAPQLGLNQPPAQVLQAEQTLEGLKAQQRDAQKRLKRALRQQTKSHGHSPQNHKTHKGGRMAGQSMRQLKSQNGR